MPTELMMLNALKKYLFIPPLIFLLGLAYMRYTYILNPNFDGDPMLLEINKFGHSISANSLVNIKSLIIYWTLFFLGNTGFFSLLFTNFDKVKTVGFYFLLLTGISVVFLALDAFWLHSPTIFSLASILKNFLLSPMFTAIAYIMVEYLHWFIKPT